MNEKMNGGISTMRGIFCRLSFQKGGITAETIAAQGFDGGIFSVDTRHLKRLGFSVLEGPSRSSFLIEFSPEFSRVSHLCSLLHSSEVPADGQIALHCVSRKLL